MLAEIAREQYTSTLLFGRTTYEIFASSWPERGDDVPLAAQLKGMTKVVVSDRIRDADATWAETRILRPRGDLPAAIARLDVLDRFPTHPHRRGDSRVDRTAR